MTPRALIALHAPLQRGWCVLLLAGCGALAQARAADVAAPPVDQARIVAADIIHGRAFDLSAAGRQDLALKLDALAKGVKDGSVTLSDAALVMQILGPAVQAVPSTPVTHQARVSAAHAESLIDGTAETTPPPGDAPVTDAPAAGAPTPVAHPVPDAPAPPKVFIAEVCGVENGPDHQVSVAALNASRKDGLLVGEHVVFKDKGVIIAQGTLRRVTDQLVFAEVTKGSLTDPKTDVSEDDKAVITVSQ